MTPTPQEVANELTERAWRYPNYLDDVDAQRLLCAAAMIRALSAAPATPQAERVQQLEAQANNAIMDASIAAERVTALSAALRKIDDTARAFDRARTDELSVAWNNFTTALTDARAALAAQGGRDG